MSTFNAFEALMGQGEQVASSNKKRNKKKTGGSGAAAPAPAAGQAAVPVSNGSAKPAAAPAPAKAAPVPASSGPAIVDVTEASAILERAAREAKTIGDKTRLWKDWVRQASDKSGKGLKYKDQDGSLLEFKQVLVHSKALEISVEACLTSGLTPEKEEVLGQLLSTFCGGSDSSVPLVLASQLIRLATLLADEAPDTVGAAQRAVHSVISTLKAGEQAGSGDSGAVAAWVNRIAKLDKDIATKQAALQTFIATSGGVVNKQQTDTARAIYKLQEEKLDLLQPENIPSTKGVTSGASEGTLRALEDLKNVINNHLREASKAEESAKGKAGSAEAQRVATLASYRREESILAQEAQDVATQIRTLDAQLKALRSKQSEIEEKRAQLQQRQRVMLDSMGGKGRQQGMSAAHYRDEIGLVDSMLDLVDPRRSTVSSPQAVLNVKQAAANTPSDYIAQGQHFLAMALASLGEVPSKISFCRQRLDKAEKLIKLGGGTDQTRQQKDESEKLLAETLRAAEELMRTGLQVVSDINQRYDAIVRFAPDQANAAAEKLRAIDAYSAQIRSAYDTVLAASRASSTDAAAAAPVGGANRPTSARPAPKPAAAPAPVAAAPVAAVAHPQSAPASRNAASRNAPAPAPAAAPVAAAPAPAAAPKPAAPPRQWGKVEAAPVSSAAPSDSYPALAPVPKPEEPVKAPAQPKKNRQKA